METKAVVKSTGISARKVRMLVDLVRGKKVDDALTLLKFTPTPTAQVVARAIKSAAANAESTAQMSASNLRVVKIYADKAESLKRFRPRSRGRVSPILKRSSHITVIVAEQES
ncbi:MAG: 50S ribosomal protein L22 [Chloroflexi bacterium]|nr:50S ribosomal protein L22 [Chloroflexota bacterium]